MNDDRRNLDRRVTALETTYARLEAEQRSLREMMTLRFQTIDRGQDLILTELRNFKEVLQKGLDDPEASPAGKALLTRIDTMQRDFDDLKAKQGLHHSRLTSMQGIIDEFKGSVNLAMAMGIGGLLLSAGLALAKWILSK